jgi:hypothetical protein
VRPINQRVTWVRPFKLRGLSTVLVAEVLQLVLIYFVVLLIDQQVTWAISLQMMLISKLRELFVELELKA